MFIDELLLPVGFHLQHEAVESGDHAANLKAIDQKNGDNGVLFTGTVEKTILQIPVFSMDMTPFSIE